MGPYSSRHEPDNNIPTYPIETIRSGYPVGDDPLGDVSAAILQAREARHRIINASMSLDRCL